MRRILVAFPVEPEHRRQFEEAAPDCEVLFEKSPTDEQLSQVEIVVGNVAPARLRACKDLQLIQLNSAGVGGYVDFSRPGSGVRVCSATGSYGLAISEHMFGMLLGLQKRLFRYRDQQYAGKWEDLGSVGSVYGANVLVIGLGDIGGEFARRCKAFGAHVTGIRRSLRGCPDYCDAVGTMEDIDAHLPGADVVFLCVPETEQTKGLLDARRIGLMKRGAIVLNAGRGSAIETDALVAALREERLFGAGLDVTDPEPLPPEHPLWQLPGAMITPHISGGYHLRETHDRIVGVACRNIRAYLAGEPLVNEVNYERGY